MAPWYTLEYVFAGEACVIGRTACDYHYLFEPLEFTLF